MSSFFLKISFKLENLGANLSSIKSLKNKLARRYSNVAPIVVENIIIIIPHHFPKIKPENNKIGIPKPSNNTQIMQKIKKLMVNNVKLLFLYSSIKFLLDLINS